MPEHSEHVAAILKLLEHCSSEELGEIAAICCKGELTLHEPVESIPTEVPWKPSVLPGDFGPEEQLPIKQTLPPSSMDATISKGRFK